MRVGESLQAFLRAGGGMARGVEPVSFTADMIGKEGAHRGTQEPRKAMMAVANVTWEDEDETVHTAPATIEDTSPSGACFRLKIPIRAGSRVEVSWCRDDFSGMNKWCREDQAEYLVGMQRDRITSKAVARTVPKAQAPSARPLDIPPAPRADSPRVREVERLNVREAERPSGREMQQVEQCNEMCPVPRRLYRQ
jgi:hypothetical protein